MARRDGGGAWEGLRLLFDRYQEGMYDLAVRMVHDSRLATAIVESAFLEIWLSFGGETPEADLRMALAFLVRNSAIDALERSERSAAEATVYESGLFFPVTADEPSPRSIVLTDLEHAHLVWQSVAALNLADYSLLHLHLRTGLTAAELAQGLGERPGVVLTTLSRLEATIQESVTDALLASRGGLACPELAAIVGQNPIEPLDPNLRFAIRHHFHHCLACQSSARAFPSAAMLFAKLPIVSLAFAEQRALWGRIAERAGQGEFVAEPLARRRRPLARGWLERWNRLQSMSPVLLVGIVVPAILVIGLIVIANLFWGVHDPGDVHSTSHTIGKVSSDTVVTVVWTVQTNVAGYSVAWTQGRRDLPIDQPNLPGTATSATSPPLDIGTWYFHLRTESQNGVWTSTVHLGPFVIQPVPPSDTPTLQPATPTETPTPSPTEIPVAPSPIPPTVAPIVVPTVPPSPTLAPPPRFLITPTSTRMTQSVTSTATAAGTVATTQTPTSGTATASVLPTVTLTPTLTTSPAVTSTKTAWGSITPTASATGSVIATPILTITITSTTTITARASVSPTASATPTITSAATATHASSATVTPTRTSVAQ